MRLAGMAPAIDHAIALRHADSLPACTEHGTGRMIVMVGASAVGQVVLLNGVSSSGKSTLACQLLADFETPWFHMGVDMFGAMRAEAQTHDLDEAGLADVLRRTRAGFHRAVRGMALAGNGIVMDHVLSEPWRHADLLRVMADVDVVFVGVHCDAAVLMDREIARICCLLWRWPTLPTPRSRTCVDRFLTSAAKPRTHRSNLKFELWRGTTHMSMCSGAPR